MRFRMSTGTMILLAMSIVGLILYFTTSMVAIDYVSVVELIVTGG